MNAMNRRSALIRDPFIVIRSSFDRASAIILPDKSSTATLLYDLFLRRNLREAPLSLIARA
jgi:hypothetical protein